MSDWPKKAYWNTVSGILYLEPINKNCIPVLIYPANQAPEAVAWIPENVLAYLQEAGFCHAELSTVELPGRKPLYLTPPDAEQIRAQERERCAKLLESLAPAGTDSVLLAAAKEIRALCTYPLCQCNEPTDKCGREPA